MVVYIDLIFAANLLIDGVLLWLTSWLVKHKVSWWRLTLSALAGALYVVMMFVPELSFLYTFLIKFGLSVLMIWIAFDLEVCKAIFGHLGRFISLILRRREGS